MASFFSCARQDGRFTVLPYRAFCDLGARVAAVQARGEIWTPAQTHHAAEIVAGTFLFVPQALLTPEHEGWIAGTTEELRQWIKEGGHRLFIGRLAANSRPCLNYVPQIPPQEADLPYMRTPAEVLATFGHTTRAFKNLLAGC